MKQVAFPFLALVLGLFSCQTPKDSATEASPLNILMIISDDQGWNDYGFMGHPQIETPHIDRLAANSLTFTRGYVTAPLCRPSLASMVSGLYPHQHGVTGNDPTFTPGPDTKRYTPEWLAERKPYNDQLVRNLHAHLTLPQLFTQAGYLTLQTGKWWEGSWRDGGFSHGMTHGDPARDARHGDEGLTIGREGLAPIYDLLDTAQAQAKPFFIWYAPYMPHFPHTPPAELETKYAARTSSPAVARYWAMCDWFDQTVGELMNTLQDRGLAENTLVVYVCDNGWIQNPDKPNRYAPRSKRSPYEMGIRTPIMYHWPGQIEARMDSQHLASSLDLMPTILAAAGMDVPAGLPGLNALDPTAVDSRQVLFAETFEHDIADIHDPVKSLQHRIMLSPPWKLILPNPEVLPEARAELYDLGQDPDETENMAEAMPERLSDMVATLDAWWQPAGPH
ncbi:MAG: sulfatase [Bacteroidetes bacterium]|nr:MAG: sulfatase [Bacteroidota bacterium]